jgi:hypothetical protein
MKLNYTILIIVKNHKQSKSQIFISNKSSHRICLKDLRQQWLHWHQDSKNGSANYTTRWY